MDEAKLLGSAELPRQQGMLHLFSRGESFVLAADSVKSKDWMNSKSAPSRQALARIPAKIISKRHQPKILMAGLGLGYTLVEALKQFNLQANIEVTEWLPEVRQWHEEGRLGEALGYPVKDDRVTVNDLDIARILRSKKQRYDVILLDTDNGPEDLLFKEKERKKKQEPAKVPKLSKLGIAVASEHSLFPTRGGWACSRCTLGSGSTRKAPEEFV